MPLNIDLYKNRLESYKNIGKEGRVESIQQNILSDFIGNPSYFKVLINDIERDVHVVTDNNKQFKVLCKPNETISTGNYVVWNDKTFLCTSVNENDSVQSKGILQKTNHNLKWINSNNKLITRPCIWSSKTLYTTGVKEEELITLPDGKVGLQLPSDADTDKLAKDDEFIFNKNKYKITYLNRVEFTGLLLLICEEELPSTADDMVNEIANRYINGVDRLTPIEPEPEEPPVEGEGITYTLTGSDTLKVSGDALYTAKKFIDGVQDMTTKFDWTVSDLTMVEIWEATDTTLDLIGKNKNVGQNFTITATDRVSGEIITKQVKMLSMY